MKIYSIGTESPKESINISYINIINIENNKEIISLKGSISDMSKKKIFFQINLI